jgi:hypothetical protein
MIKKTPRCGSVDPSHLAKKCCECRNIGLRSRGKYHPARIKQRAINALLAGSPQRIAIDAIWKLIKTGKLDHPSKFKCVDCKERQAKCYDHRYYSKPLDVEPVCRQCNAKRGPALDWDPKDWVKKAKIRMDKSMGLKDKYENDPSWQFYSHE